MRIFFYPPFKPLGHPHPSGDLIIATGLYDFLEKRGHKVWTASSLRARWIFWKPWLLPKVLLERRRSIINISKNTPDLWLTYHTYYKAPDVLGPAICNRTGLPYIIFQGIFSTKRKRNLKTIPGYLLNKNALRASNHVFTNRKEDQVNLERLLPKNRITYIPPGIYPDNFSFSDKNRSKLRQEWGVGDDPVICSAAMFRPGIKTKGLSWVIRACGDLYRKGVSLHLVIAGDGKERTYLTQLAKKKLGNRARFVGKIPRIKMAEIYSACDLFAFPGFRESLGMVFLEAQSCGLPIVACYNGGIPEVVKSDVTGLLVPLHSFDDFTQAIARLLKDKHLSRKMGQNAKRYIHIHHDLNKNYEEMEITLKKVIENQHKDHIIS